jgi:phage-related protein
MRQVIWIGSSRRDLKILPEDVKDQLGFALFHAQCNIQHPSIKILQGFGSASVQEIRTDDRSGTYRAVYTIKFKGFLYVLHVFRKKSKTGIATAKSDMGLVQQRLLRAQQDFKNRSIADEG